MHGAFTEQDFSAFKKGPDGFPCPGQVIRHFRQMKLKDNGKPWTQRDLAQALGKQELAIREMELRDNGLNDMSRRRFLSQLLNIPPLLLGLAPALTESQTEDNAPPWWAEQGFPAFEKGADGFPRPGQVIRHFRQLKLKADGKSWTQYDLAQVLDKQVLAIREMELKDTGLNEYSRRRFLEQACAIPPLLLGLASMPQQETKGLISFSNPPKFISSSKTLDLAQVRDKLTSFWTQNACPPQEMLLAIDSLLKQFYERYPTASSYERIKLITTLCEFHIHSANILRDSGRSNKALEHLGKTKDLSILLSNQELMADALYRRGGVYLESGKNSLALKDYHAAEQLLPHVSPPLQAALLLEIALSEAREATSQQEHTLILKRLDRAGYLIRTKETVRGREQLPYLNVDRERYHLDRAATLIILGEPKEALDELHLLTSKPLSGRRSVYYLILQAQSYFGQKEYLQAAILAEEALAGVRQVHSRVNLERIKTLYKELRLTSFQNNPEVERLDYLLFHTKH